MRDNLNDPWMHGPFNIIVERDVEAPMRDGTILRADVYRPDAPGPFPVLVMRTPYNKAGANVNALVRAGYIVVVQDIRGRYASDGEFESFLRPDNHEAEDGYDTVEWAARLPGSTGKVGTFGGSYCAWLQWKLAALRPPSLVAMFAYSIPARYTDLEGPGSIRPGRRLYWWACSMAPDMRRRAGRPGSYTPEEAREEWKRDRGKWLWFLPWVDLPAYVLEDAAEDFREWLRHPHTDPWQLDKLYSEIEVPNLHITGWYDHCNPCLDHFTGMVAHGRTELARKGQKVIIGPWNHGGGFGKRKIGEVDFGPQAQMDLNAVMVRWFDYWLKGVPNGVDREPAVKLFVMGENRWKSYDRWPPSSRDLTLFLTSNGEANTPFGDGRLVKEVPPDQKQDRYVYDPRDPVMSLYGERMFTMPADQRALAHRRDILVYQTEPLKEDLEVTGYPKVVLYASSSAPDTDFFARLIDVHPDGRALDICMGVVRARYRESLERPTLLEPGKVTEFTIRLGPTSNRFKAGHRIRLDITSSDFPNYDRNHNTGLDDNADPRLAVAHQTVYHGGRYPSRLHLPWIP